MIDHDKDDEQASVAGAILDLTLKMSGVDNTSAEGTVILDTATLLRVYHFDVRGFFADFTDRDRTIGITRRTVAISGKPHCELLLLRGGFPCKQ